MSTLEDVARSAGVSPSTVSRAFTKPNRINVKTRERILEAAARVNYLPLRSHTGADPQTLEEHGRPPTIGFHFFAYDRTDELTANPFYSRILAGAIAEASTVGCQVLLSSSAGRVVSETDLSVALERLPDAMVLAGNASTELIERMVARTRTCVLVDAVDEGRQIDSIVADNMEGSRAMTEYLIGLGHRRIAFLPANAADRSFRERLNGYLSALYWAGITIDNSLIVASEAGIDFPRPGLERLLAASSRPTAIVTASDHYAHWIYSVCAEKGLAIPGDLSVGGFDNDAFSARMLPPMTTVHVDAETMGAMAVAYLIERAAQGGRGDNRRRVQRIVVPTRLVARESCACLKQ